jgi:hypothetical protein
MVSLTDTLRMTVGHGQRTVFSRMGNETGKIWPEN